jgi:hypothetical protein
MELKNKINIIWYGRGNLNAGDECVDFNLEELVDGVGPSNSIELVYKVVSESTGSSAWKTWSSAIFEEGDFVQGEFTKLECGHLYIVVLKDNGAGSISNIDIPEAISVDGADVGLTQLDGKDLVVSPDDEVAGDDDGGDDDDIPEICLDETWKVYTFTSESGSREFKNGDTIFSCDGTLALDGMEMKIGVKPATDFISDGATETDDLVFRFSDSSLLNLNNCKLPEVSDGTVIPVRIEITGVGANDAFSTLIGCYHGNAVSGTLDGSPQPLVSLEKILDEQDSDDGIGDGGDDGSGELQTFEQCVAFNGEADGSYRLAYKKPTEGTPSASNFTFTQNDGSDSVVDLTSSDSSATELSSLISNLLESEGLKLDVNFALYFTATWGDSLTPNAINFAIVYPNLGETQTLSCGSNCQATTAQITGLKIYDPSRDAGECAIMNPSEMGGVQVFQGTEI